MHNKLTVKDTKIVLCPPFVYLNSFNIKCENVALGAQNIATYINTKSTGEISPNMLKEFGVSYAIIGHSEQRSEGLTDEQISNKVKVAVEAGIVPIICVGEESKLSSLNLLQNQVKTAISKIEKSEVVFAYEPVWAIGTGEIPTVERIDEAINLINTTAKEMGFDVKILYGGSVNKENYAELMETKAQGFLLGGVSLKVNDFIEIVKGADNE